MAVVPFHWIFHTPLPEQTEAFTALAAELAPEFAAELESGEAPEVEGLVLRASFAGEELEAEERGRAYWLELHSRCLDVNLAMELVEGFEPAHGWQPLGSGTPKSPDSLIVPASPATDPESLVASRPDIPPEPLYGLLLADDPDMERNLNETNAWIEAAGLPVINLLSYLDLPLFAAYAAEHAEERDQNLFLHMLHTWTCYRRYGEVHARLPRALADSFTDPRYLRLNTTQFRSPAPALCVQFEDWSQPLRAAGTGKMQWVKEIYLTHLEPPTPADDRELTLMLVSYDQRGEYGFIPLEVPLSLPGVGQSIEAFFAPSAGDEELGANTHDLARMTAIAATYCLYATARDPTHYLTAAT